MTLLQLFILIVIVCCANGLPEDVYYKVPVPLGFACYKLLNGTHELGCTAGKDQSEGIVIVIESKAEIEDINGCWRNRFPKYDEGFFIVLDVSLLDRPTLSTIRQSDCVNGVILTNSNKYTLSTTGSYSHDSSCPNYNSGYYKNGCENNAFNSEFSIFSENELYFSMKKQLMFVRNETHIDSLKSCYKLFNVPSGDNETTGYPYCSASFSVDNWAGGSSEICYRRSNMDKTINLDVDGTVRLCSELYSLSTVALIPPNIVKEDKEIGRASQYLMISGRVDSMGLIPEISPAEITVLTSLFAYYTAAQAIGKHGHQFEKSSNKSNKYLIWSLFDAETYDYIGSSSFAYNLAGGNFPSKKAQQVWEAIEPRQIKAVVEVQQLGVGEDSLNVLVDSNQWDHQKDDIKKIYTSLSNGAQTAKTTINQPYATQLPASTWHSMAKANDQILGLIITSAKDKYAYSRFNSMIDRNEWSSEDRQRLMRHITSAAYALIHVSADFVKMPPSDLKSIKIDENFISTLIDCFFTDSLSICPLLEKIKAKNEESYDRDVYQASFLAKIAPRMMVYLTGNTTYASNVKTEETCNALNNKPRMTHSYQWLQDPFSNKSHCIRHNVISLLKSSPAFEIPGYDFKNSTYSTWTQSHYEFDDLKLFLLQKKSYEVVFFAHGIVLAIISILLVGRCSDSTFIFDEGEIEAELGEPL